MPDHHDNASKHLSKQEFGRRLYNLMHSKGWTQSELARKAGLSRDAISTYVRGLHYPDPANAEKLAKVFGMSAEELLPNQAERSIDRDPALIELKVSSFNPAVAWLRVNRMVSTNTALKIMTILREDDVDLSDAS